MRKIKHYLKVGAIAVVLATIIILPSLWIIIASAIYLGLVIKLGE